MQLRFARWLRCSREPAVAQEMSRRPKSGDIHEVMINAVEVCEMAQM